MTRALYHDPEHPLSQPLQFTATVVEVNGTQAALDATAFYPEGGGQSADVGVWRWDGGEARVLGARKDRASGLIWHELDGPLPPVGTLVASEVDADTRWRHSQRHSGEHLLAQAFTRVNPVFEVAAVSMTSPECTLDLRGDPAESHVHAAEALLRGVLGRADLSLQTPVVPEQELERYPLRRASQVRGQVRLVIFRAPDGTPFDVSACGGTHVPRASMAAPVVVLRTERVRGGLTRVVFMAGEEAANHLAGVYRDARALAQTFSVPVERLTERVEALRAERDAVGVELELAQKALALAAVRATSFESVGTIPMRALSLTDPSLLAGVLGAAPAGEVVVALTPDGRCGIGSGRPDLDAGALLRGALARTGGKGGGRPELAQGRTDQPEAFLNTVREILGER